MNNDMTKRITVFADADLDGAGCVLVTKWTHPDCIVTHKTANERNFKEVFESFKLKSEYDASDEIFICDLNVSEEHHALIDIPKVTYFDHHNLEHKLFTKATLRCDSTPSCTSFVQRNCPAVTLAPHQRLLISLIDDYDSYELKHAVSLNLNTVFFAQRGDRIQAFCDAYKDGFKGFNDHQNNIIRFHTLKVNQIKENLEVFQADVSLAGNTHKIVSAFTDYAISEIASYILAKHKGDIAIVINPKTNNVSFRKTKGLKYDISILAKNLAAGAGNSNAAGGKLTPQMMNFSRIFKPV